MQSETFKIMERRLLRAIINPAMIVAWVFGLWLAWTRFSVSLAAGCTRRSRPSLACRRCMAIFAPAVALFAEDRNDKSARHWRIVNEIPTFLMIVIVILVVVKPF